MERGGEGVPAAIVAERLTKTYQVKVRDAGLGGAVRALVRLRYREVRAVEAISFQVERGEIVAFLGPNGAGKTTTLKMLTGLLYPTAGRAHVAGFTPWDGGSAFKRRIALVLGNKQQLLWDLPPEETFQLNQAIYAVPATEFRARRDELVALLDLAEVMDKPVRQLSLGERMKCELAAALLHRPEILFLDEPTLGLDVTAQEAVRGFLCAYRARHGATILLTSHYMADVTALASRVLIINRGRLLYDGALQALVARMAHTKRLELVLGDGVSREQLAAFGEVREFRFPNAVLEVPRDQATAASARLLASVPVVDLSIQDPALEDVIRRAFAEGAEGGHERVAAPLRGARAVGLARGSPVPRSDRHLDAVERDRARHRARHLVVDREPGRRAGLRARRLRPLLLRRGAREPAHTGVGRLVHRPLGPRRRDELPAGAPDRPRPRSDRGQHRLQGTHRVGRARRLDARRPRVAGRTAAVRARPVGAVRARRRARRGDPIPERLRHRLARLLDDAGHGVDGAPVRHLALSLRAYRPARAPAPGRRVGRGRAVVSVDRKSTRLNSSH